MTAIPMHLEWDMPIAIDDGLFLRADVFRAEDAWEYPVILTYGPYAAPVIPRESPI